MKSELLKTIGKDLAHEIDYFSMAQEIRDNIRIEYRRQEESAGRVSTMIGEIAYTESQLLGKLATALREIDSFKNINRTDYDPIGGYFLNLLK